MTELIDAPQPLKTLRDVHGGPIEVGAPEVSGPLAVFPLFGPPAALEYKSFSRAHTAAEVAITELASGASVNDLAIDNRGGVAVLLYEGEELIGAQQNRVLDITLLVGASSKTRIPVSCVEHGRWDGSRHGEAFSPSRQAADPELRKLKAQRVRERVADGGDARANQGEVWEQVAGRMQDLGAASPTQAMSDVYEHHRDALDEFRNPISIHENQIGAVCAIGGRISILDLVGRADVWADLHPALLEGYALDALRYEQTRGKLRTAGEERNGSVPRRRWVHEFIGRATAAPASAEHRRHDAGLGETVRFADLGVAGSATVVSDEGTERGEELVQLTAHPDGTQRRGWNDQPGGGRPRVRRPSQRR